jgi:hypothetical protein
MAARSVYRDIAQLLLGSGASLDVRNRDQETLLHLTCDNEWPDVSNLLIDHDSDMDSKGDHGLIPLHTAPANGHLVIVGLLLESDRGSDVNLREAKRCTPLHYASKYGHLEVAQLLMERGVDVNSHTRNGSTVLHNAWAVRSCRDTDETRSADQTLVSLKPHTTAGFKKVITCSQADIDAYVALHLLIRNFARVFILVKLETKPCGKTGEESLVHARKRESRRYIASITKLRSFSVTLLTTACNSIMSAG